MLDSQTPDKLNEALRRRLHEVIDEFTEPNKGERYISELEDSILQLFTTAYAEAMNQEEQIDELLGAFPCYFKPEEYGSRTCIYCGESKGELRHTIKTTLLQLLTEAERRGRIDELKRIRTLAPSGVIDLVEVFSGDLTIPGRIAELSALSATKQEDTSVKGGDEDS